MPKDKRLYMTFPIDFDEHPKVEPLSDAAFRTFVAMNGYSRRQKLDGSIPAIVARKKWRVKALGELVASHPERPLVSLVDGFYVLREYAEHQFTTADEMDLHAKRSAAGAKGGKSKASALALARQDPQQNQAESESGSRLLTDVTYEPESSHEGNGPISVPDSMFIRAREAGIVDLHAVQRALQKAAGQSVSLRGAVLLTQAIVSKSARAVQDVDAYIAVVCRNSALEIQQAYFDLDIGALP